MIGGNDRRRNILNLGLELFQIKDLEPLLDKILGEARLFTNCDAGSIYVKEGKSLRFSYTQNDTLLKKQPKSGKPPYSAFNVPIGNQSIAGYVAANGTILNIPDVYNLDASSPFSFNRAYDNITGYRTRSMLAIPLNNFRGEIIGVLQLLNAMGDTGNAVPFARDDGNIMVYFANSAASAIEHARMTREFILRMNKMTELRDPKETGPHVIRVASYAGILYEGWARMKGLSQGEIRKNHDLLRMSAMLHDVGKIAISDTILQKPGRFTPEEFKVMKMHTLLGANLFEDIHTDFDESAAIVALNHHERWDGRGYPGHIDLKTRKPLPGYETKGGGARGKKGNDIPLFGRIVALADVYDALSSRRCYKEAWDENSVITTIREEAGKQFDPELVKVFMECVDDFRQVESLYPNETAHAL